MPHHPFCIGKEKIHLLIKSSRVKRNIERLLANINKMIRKTQNRNIFVAFLF